MVFMCCHPSLPPDARVALSLKTVGGFSVAEIARAFLCSEPTIAQRLVRAKRTLRDHDVGLELPAGSDLARATSSRCSRSSTSSSTRATARTPAKI